MNWRGVTCLSFPPVTFIVHLNYHISLVFDQGNFILALRLVICQTFNGKRQFWIMSHRSFASSEFSHVFLSICSGQLLNTLFMINFSKVLRASVKSNSPSVFLRHLELIMDFCVSQSAPHHSPLLWNTLFFLRS